MMIKSRLSQLETLMLIFASEEAKLLIEFLKRTLNLTMNTDSREGTTKYGTTIDAVFSVAYRRTFGHPCVSQVWGP
ncbi:hypothetical protein TNCV_892861 [Trichonephila clavipes]|nr:hypothetical protein TNCV_892861 [Trichonephila clavipes]